MADCEGISCLEFRLEMCLNVLKQYSWLLDSYVLDFFTENHIERLPKSWKNDLEKIPLNDFHYLMDFSLKNQNNVWSLSILCLRVLMQFLTLSRKVKTSKTSSTCFKHAKLKNLFLKHVKPKKRHEIFDMAKRIAETANKLNVNYVVDVGSGLGHLSRVMAYGFDLKVCSIETQSELTKQAEKLDSEFEMSAQKYLNEVEMTSIRAKRPIYRNQTIRFDLNSAEFLKKVRSDFSVGDDNISFGIIGLHPCGDLASALLKLYTDCSEAKFIKLVGCCYHKLTTENTADLTKFGSATVEPKGGDSIITDNRKFEFTDTETLSSDIVTSVDPRKSQMSENTCELISPSACNLVKGFPLTDFHREKWTCVGYEARSLACHAIENYSDRIKSERYDRLKVHCYRAALEKIIHKNWPHFRKSGLCNVKSTPGLSFNEYCQFALKKLDLTVPDEDLTSEETQKNLSNWQAVVKFYSFRLMLAPLIETVILLDRKLFLLKKGIPCEVVAAFDPEISPRNQLLISEKLS